MSDTQTIPQTGAPGTSGSLPYGNVTSTEVGAQQVHKGGCPCQFCGQSPFHVRTENTKPLPEDVNISVQFAPTPRAPHKITSQRSPAYNTVEVPGGALDNLPSEANQESTLRITKGDQAFEAKLAQFHTHFKGEHKVDGKQGDGEVHFVFKSPEGHLAVVAVMVKAGKTRNPELEKVLEAMGQPHVEKKTILGRAARFLKNIVRPSHGAKQEVLPPLNHTGQVDFSELMSSKPDIFYTVGSLTAPNAKGDYLESQVQWIIFEKPIEATKDQVRRFSKVIGAQNNRPLFPSANRPVFKGKINSVVADRVITGKVTREVLHAPEADTPQLQWQQTVSKGTTDPSPGRA